MVDGVEIIEGESTIEVIEGDDGVIEILETVAPLEIIEKTAQGLPGVGLPPGGTTGQVATKASNADNDIVWQDPTGGGGDVQSVNSGTGITVDNTDPENPIVNSNITQYTDGMAISALGPTLANYLLSSTAASTYVALGGSYANPSWITSLAWSKISGAPTFITGVAWGQITGSLADQTDLQAALDSKVESVNSGTGITVDNTDPANPIVNSTITQYTDGMAVAALGPTLANYLLSSTAASTYQPLDADLTALAALGSTGFAARTAANTWAQRSLAAPAAGITIANPAGIAGNPTFALANDLAALEGLASTGYAVRTAADTWAQRTFTAGTGLAVTNGNGVSGGTSYALAAIAARSVVANTTNASAAPTSIQLGAGQVVVGNGFGTGLEVVTLIQNITNQDGFLYPNGGSVNVNRLIQNQFTQMDSTPPVYANSTGETSIMGNRINGDQTTYFENLMTPGSNFRLRAWGFYSYKNVSSGGAGGTLQIKVNVNGTSSGVMLLLSTDIFTPTPTTGDINFEWNLDADIMITEDGVIWAQGKIWMDSDDLTGRFIYPMKNLDVLGGIDFSTEDWTWDITADWSAADEVNTIRQTNCILERYKPLSG